MILNTLDKNNNSLFSNSIYLYLSYFSDYILSIFLLPFIARTVGAVELGTIGVFQTFGIFISLLMEFGSSLFITKEISKLRDNKNETKVLIGKVFTLKISLIPVSIFISIIAYFFVPIFSNNPKYIVIVLLGSIFHGLTPNWFFEGNEKMKQLACSKILFRLVSFVMILTFVKSPLDGWKFLTILLMSSFFICLYLSIVMIKSTGLPKIFNFNGLIRLSNQSIISFLITIIPLLFQNISIFALSISISPIQLGILYGANRIYRAFNSLFSPLSQAFFPIISSKYVTSEIESKSLIKNYLILILSLGIIFLLTILFFSNQIILILLGSEYLSAQNALIIFGFVLPLTAVSNSLGRQWLLAKNNDLEYLISNLISFVVTMVAFFPMLESLRALSLPLSLIIYEITNISMASLFIFKNKSK